MSKRSNGEGTIFKRKDGRWCAAYYDDSDQPKRHFVYASTQQAVKKKLQEKKIALEIGCQKEYLLQDWIDEYLENYKKNEVKKTTYGSYRELYQKHIKNSDLGKKLLSKLKANDLQRFYNDKMSVGYNPKTIKHMQVIINSALEQAFKEKKIAENPNRYVVLPKKKKYEARVLSMEHIQTLLDNAKGDRLYPIVITTLFTGMRKGEVMGLHWSNIDFEKRQIHIVGSLCRVAERDSIGGKMRAHYEILEPKNKKSIRTIPMLEIVVEALRVEYQYQEKEKEKFKDIYVDNDLVFARYDGNYIAQRPFMDKYHAFLKCYNIPDCRFHDLRHSFATIMLELGNISTKTVQEILGHSTISTTMDIYTHVSQQVKDAAFEELNRKITHSEESD